MPLAVSQRAGSSCRAVAQTNPSSRRRSQVGPGRDLSGDASVEPICPHSAARIHDHAAVRMLDHRRGSVGLARLVTDTAFSPTRVDELLLRG